MKRPGELHAQRRKHLVLQANRDELAKWRAGARHLKLTILDRGVPRRVRVHVDPESDSLWLEAVVLKRRGRNRLVLGESTDRDGVTFLVTSQEPTAFLHQHQYEFVGVVQRPPQAGV